MVYVRFTHEACYRANKIPKIVSRSPPPKAAAPGRFKIPVSGSLAPVGAAVTAVVTVLVAVGVEVIVVVGAIVPVGATVGVFVAVGVPVPVGEAVGVGVGVTVTVGETVGVGVPVTAATVKLTLQLSPPSHSVARGRLVGAVGT